MFRQINDPFTLIVMAIVAAAFLRFFIYQIRVRMSGTETTAVITAVTEETRHDSDGVMIYYDYHVVYTDRNGRRVFGTLSNPGLTLKEGDEIIIRYVDDEPETPVYIRKV